MLTSIPMKRLAIVAAAGLCTSVAWATPPSKWGGEGLVAAKLQETVQINDERIKFQTKGPTDTLGVKLVWQPGGSSGWHHHPGMVIVQVASGLIDVTRLVNGQCKTTRYGVGSPNGSTFTEGDFAHVATSSDGAVAYATAIVSDGVQGRLDDPAPSCATNFGLRKPK